MLVTRCLALHVVFIGSLFHIPNMSEPRNDILSLFRSLVEIVERLRGPGGCPWDQEQTQKSLAPYALEEAYELVEAIESGKQDEISDELGDFLFQVILQAEVAKNQGHFDLSTVISKISEKMIRRHPHVFAKTQVQDAAEVWVNWDQLKNQEAKTKPKSLTLFSYPRNLPALQAASKIGRKTETWRFDWDKAEDILAKVKEETQELEIELKQLSTEEIQSHTETKNRQRLEHEIGDLLFSVSQLARFCRIDPEAALRKTNSRFENRFQNVLTRSGLSKEQFIELPQTEKEKLWQMVKKDEQ